MKSNHFKLSIFFILFSCCFAFSQNLKKPDIFSKKMKVSEMQKFYSGAKSMEGLVSNSSYNWIVYSDRKANTLYTSPGGAKKTLDGKTMQVDFFDSFYVREVKYQNGQNYLKVSKVGYENLIYGWVNAKNLVLSQHCLLTDVEVQGSKKTVPVPKKAMILVSLNELKGDLGVEQIKKAAKIIKDKKYYKTPLAKKSSETGEYLTKFQIFFVYKYDTDNKAYLLGKTDVLMGSKNQETEMLGWTERWTITDWSTRVCFEPREEEAYHDREFISGKPGLLPGYEQEKHLETGLKSGIYPDYIDKNNSNNSKSYIISYRAEKMPHNRMRMPLLEEKGKYWVNPENPNDKRQIYNVVSIAKDNTDISEESKNKYHNQLDQLTKMNKDVNVVFAIDATGSMKKFKEKIAESLSEIERLNKINEDANLNFAFIFYRDYNDGGPALGKKLAFNSSRQKVALEYLPLFPAKGSNMAKFKSIINGTTFGSAADYNENTNDPEALFNGLINGLKGIFESEGKRKSDIYQTHSNVLVLIGDCGNYAKDFDKNKYDLGSVSSILNKYRMNVITFQVNNEGGTAYNTFFLDGRKLGKKVGEDWIKGKEDLKLKVSFKKEQSTEGQDIRRLTIYSEKENVGTDDLSVNYTPVFSKFVAAKRGKNFLPNTLKKLIEDSFREYMEALSNNIAAVNAAITGGVEGQEPSPLLVAMIMDMFDYSEGQARDWLKKQEITVEAKIVNKYLPGKKSLNRVAFLTEQQLEGLVSELEDNMLGNQYGSKKSDFVKRRKDFQGGLSKMVQTMIGSSGIDDLTLDDSWKVIFGAPFSTNKYKKLKDIKISSLSTLKGKEQKTLDEFIGHFFEKTEQFIDKIDTYSVRNPFERREFKIVGVDGSYFWVPLSDLPGTSN